MKFKQKSAAQIVPIHGDQTTGHSNHPTARPAVTRGHGRSSSGAKVKDKQTTIEHLKELSTDIRRLESELKAKRSARNILMVLGVRRYHIHYTIVAKAAGVSLNYIRLILRRYS